MDLERTRRDVVELLESNAHWRDRKARQYPDDDRNLDAAEACRQLAAAAAALPPEVFAAYAAAEERFWGDEEDDETEARVMQWQEEQSQLLRSIGFHWFPHDAREFLDALTATFDDGLELPGEPEEGNDEP